MNLAVLLLLLPPLPLGLSGAAESIALPWCATASSEAVQHCLQASSGTPRSAQLALLTHFAQPDQAIPAGRKALDHWWGYPWYDAKLDGVRRIDVAPPRKYQWPGFALPDALVQAAAWIGIALLLGGLLYLLLRAYRRRTLQSRLSQDDAAGMGDSARIESLPAFLRGRADLLAEARRHYAQGDYGRAIVYLFSFQLLELDKQQLLRLSQGKTNRQYLRELGQRQALRQLLEQTMLAFEDVFFGNHALDRARFESCWSRLDEFHSLAAEATT